MAKTLVGLYDSFAEAEQVVQKLLDDGFARRDISLATHEAAGHHGDYMYAEATSSADRKRLLNRLETCGVPAGDANTYTEGVRRGGSLVVLKTSDAQADRGMVIMNNANLVDINERMAHWRQEGWTYPDSKATPHAVTNEGKTGKRSRKGATAKGEATVPVIEEEISVEKRETERGRVRIHVSQVERPVEEHVPVREERVVVERHPVDRPATEADLGALKDETIEVTEMAEEPVVRKRARVVEEVVVHKDVKEHTETVRDTVRHTDVNVEQAETHAAAEARGFETYASAFRQHYTSTFADRGEAYEKYEQAYRYGYSLTTNPRYRGRNWGDVEADVQRDWEARHVGTWDRYRDAIYYGWDKCRVRP